MSKSIFELVDQLPKDNMTVKALRALDFVVPGEWNNLVGFENTIRTVTGETDEELIQQIAIAPSTSSTINLRATSALSGSTKLLTVPTRLWAVPPSLIRLRKMSRFCRSSAISLPRLKKLKRSTFL